MGYEIDFLAVGEKPGEKSGDAITFRFGNLFGSRQEQTVVVVDAGYVDDGDRVVEHLKTFYGTSHIDLLISTHPDQDHIGGMRKVLELCTVGQMWIHQPWSHTQDIAAMFRDGRVTDSSIRESIRKSLEGARAIETTARAKGIPISEPFTGMADGTGKIFVVGPTKSFYESLLIDFRCTPTPRVIKSMEGFFRTAIEVVAGFIDEHWHIETLSDHGETTAENNSSVVLLLFLDGDQILLTADAGIPALTQAVDFLDAVGYDKANLKLVQVPHHGSRRNVGPTLLNRLLGQPLDTDRTLRHAVVSAALDGAPKHPSKKVTNAFRRRGAPVVPTAGKGLCRSNNAPERDGWGIVEALPFYFQVEEDGDD
jgi:beta-lactamase superfamily II metal-dependent hydrolase